MYNIRKSITGENNITIQDGAETSLVGCNIEGNSYQETYQGKNLFDASKITDTTIVVNNNGKDIIMPVKTSGNGYNPVASKLSIVCPTLQAGDVVYLHMDRSPYDTMKIAYLNGSSSVWNNHASHTITQAELDGVFTLYANNYTNGETEQVTISNLIISKTNITSSNDWEPYVGGTTSPNPDYPQEVEVVEGYNILNNTATTQTKNGVTFTVNDDGSVTLNGSLTSSGNEHLKINSINFKAGKTYTMSGVTGYTSSTLQLFTNSNSAFPVGHRLNSYNGATSQTALADETCDVNLHVYSGTTYNNVTIYPMITEGNETLSYVPYNNIGVNVVGKNLLPFNSNYIVNYGVTFTKNDDGSLSVNGTATNTSYRRITENLHLEPDTYVLSGGYIDSNSYLAVQLRNDEGFTRYYATNSSEYKVFTIPDGEYIAYVQARIGSGSVVDNYTFYPMLEKGSTATEYEQYKSVTTPIDLQGNFIGKIGSYKDELNIDDLGNIILTKRIGKVVLDGSEDWTDRPNFNDCDRFVLETTTIPTQTQNGLSNYFNVSKNIVSTIGTLITNVGTQITINFSTKGTTTLAQFKTWLNTHNTIVYYVLETPYQVNLGKANIELNEGANYITLLTGLDTRSTITYESDTSAFREQSYSGESNYRANLTIYHNNVANAIDMSQIARITIKDPIIDTTSQIFYLGSFIAKSLTIKFKNFDGIDISTGDKVTLDIGQDVNGEYIYIPIGEFYVDDLAENYQTTCEIVCNDASVKFKQAVDYSSCFVDNKATIDTILQEICEICDVPLGKYPTTNGDIEIGTFNNTISGKQWISYIAELKGCNAKIDRYGRLTLIPLKQSSKVSINALESSSWNLGEKYSISQVRYYNGSIWYESPVNPENTQNILYIRNDNPFINSNDTLDNIYNAVGQCEIYNVKTTNYGDITLDAYDNITYDLGNNSYQTLNDNTIVYEMSLMTTVENKISTKQQETTTNVVAGDVKAQLRTVSTKVDLVNAKVTQNISDISELQTSTTEIEQSTDSITTRINGMSTSINDLNQQVTQFNETYEERTKNSYTLWFSESGIEGDIETLQNAMNNNSEEITSIKKYIRQVSGNIELGEEGSQMKVVISNDRISFYTGNDESAYISQDKLYITDSTILNKLQVGNWETKEDSNHNLNTKWIG